MLNISFIGCQLPFTGSVNWRLAVERPVTLDMPGKVPDYLRS